MRLGNPNPNRYSLLRLPLHHRGGCFGAILVVEDENQLIIAQANGVHKGVNEHFAVGLLAHIRLAEFAEPEGDELLADFELGNLDSKSSLAASNFSKRVLVEFVRMLCWMAFRRF